MPLTLGIGMVGANVAGGLIGNAMSSGDKQQALDLQKQALQNIMNVNAPTAQQLQVALQKYQLAGQLSPEMEAVVNAGPSLMENIQVDPRLRNAQMQALQTMQQIGAGGLRPEDIAALAQTRQATEQQANADRQSILQQMQQRGLGGSGAELAAQLNASQSAANRANTAGLDMAGQASQRALQAIANSAGMGSQLEGQQFGEASQQAQAQDIINRYNAMNQQQVGNQNVSVKNAAQSQNLSNLQNILNMNTGVANQQSLYNANTYQQAYQDALQRAQAAAGATGQAAQGLNQSAAQTQALYGGLGKAAGQGIAAGVMYNKTPSSDSNYMDVLKGNKALTQATSDDGASNPNAI